MQTGNVTTPFGRRPMTLALVRRQKAVADIEPGKTVDKWKVFRDASAAMELLGIQSNSLAVLDALLSFYPGNELSQDAQTIVFPSNMQLSLRAHGIADATLRRHIAVLVEAGLIIRKDSPNGKRYARKDGAGQVERAFGFDLSPLLARSEELALLAQQVTVERMAFRKAKENLTICRRDVRKLISAAIEEGADGDWQAIEEVYIELVGRIPRVPTLASIETILDEMRMLQEEVVTRLELQEDSSNSSGNAAHSERHIQNSKPESYTESEPPPEKEPAAQVGDLHRLSRVPLKAFPLDLVLKACPTMHDYGPRGGIESWRDLMAASVVVRSALGVSPSAYQDACEAMGAENAAAAMACILERAHLINSPGGYLRDLSRRAGRHEFLLGPMIMALLKANGREDLKVG